jgi:hypothetical protein
MRQPAPKRFRHAIELDHRDFKALHDMMIELEEAEDLVDPAEIEAAKKIHLIYARMLTRHSERKTT